ncbi:MAG: PQQ-dependent sugar dehydrogenase [Litorimonas sp.]
MRLLTALIPNSLGKLIALGGMVVALSSCGQSDAAETQNKQTVNQKNISVPSQAWGRVDASPINYNIEVVADKIDHPWSLMFLPEGGMLLTERGGLLKHMNDDGVISLVKDFSDIEGAPVHTKSRGQAGLFDIALHPDFINNRQIFISYAAKVGKGLNTLVIRRFTYDADGKLDEGEQIFAANPPRKESNHYGGRMVFPGDGTLMIPHGEAYNKREQAQVLDNHFGKILRINLDGTIPQDNPFVDEEGALPEIWSYGHRNPQGIILGADGQIYENEHGPKGGDEINIIERGVNYGWPAATYGIDYSGAVISPFQTLPNMRQSLVHFIPSIAPSGMVQYSGGAFPELKGDLLLPALAAKHVRHVEMKVDGTLGEQREMFGELNARIRDVEISPEGYIYLLLEERNGPNGKILRAVPK